MEYYPSISWQKEGKDFNPDGVKESETTINKTTDALDILVTRESGSHIYSCSLKRRNHPESDEKSEDIQLYPQGMSTF